MNVRCNTHAMEMQWQALILAEERPIHLHRGGQSERAALRKLQPRNLQSLGRGGGHGHTHTLLRFHQNSRTHPCVHSQTHWCRLFPPPGSLNSSMRTLFSKVNSPSDSPPRCVCVCVHACKLVCVRESHSSALVCVRGSFIFCVSPAEG